MSGETIEIRLDGEPVAKARARYASKTGHFHPEPKTAAFELQLQWAAKIAMKNRAPLTGAIQMTFIAFLPIPKSWSAKDHIAALRGEIYPTAKPDWDNSGKITDALNKIVWLDDAQVVMATVHKRYSDRPRLEISITPLDG